VANVTEAGWLRRKGGHVSLAESLVSERTCFCIELYPPKGIDLTTQLDLTYKLRGVIDAYVVPDNPGGAVRMCSTVLARRLLEIGQEPVLGLSCRDKNELALQATLLGACADGIHWFVASDGGAAHGNAKGESLPAGGLRPHELLAAARAFGEGKDLMGHPLSGALKISGGAEIDPFLQGEALKSELGGVELRAAVGAKFLMTPPVPDVGGFTEAIAPLTVFGVPIIARLALVSCPA